MTRTLTLVAVACVLAAGGSTPLLSPVRAQAPAPTAAIVLGVGSPNISAERSGTSIGIVASGTLYLFDAGPGVERRIMEAARKLIPLQVQQFGPVFISHIHQDHTLGLAALLWYHDYRGMLAASYVGTPAPRTLTVYGPAATKDNPGVGDIMRHLQAAFPTMANGVRVGEMPVVPINIAPRVVHRDSALTVAAFEVPHIPNSFGFRVQTADRVIVISGDTRETDAVVNACNGCDLLFHEVYGLTDDEPGNNGRHISATALGELARRARPKHLVIYHDVRIPSQQVALQVIGKAFSGKVTFARDLDIF